MTSPYEHKYVIKVDGGVEVQSLINRMEDELSPLPPFTVHPYGLGFEDQSTAEAVIDNPRINREGKSELFLEVNPPQASIVSSRASAG